MANIIEMPKLGFDMAEGTLINWALKEGDEIKKGDVIAEIETDKATVQVESSFSGKVYKQLVEINATVPVGTPIAIISVPDEVVDIEELLNKSNMELEKDFSKEKKSQEIETETDPKSLQDLITESDKRIKASPLAKMLAAEKNIIISNISGSGPGGRIVKQDVLDFLENKSISEPIQSGLTKPIAKLEEKKVNLSKLRLAIGKRMQKSMQESPHFFITNTYDVEFLLKMREKINRDRNKEERISINDFIVKAVALTLLDFPNLNSSIENEKIVMHGEVNIGIAVAIENGLLTAVCRNADKKSLIQISDEIRSMVSRIKSGKVNPEDVEGSTFTISNLGMFGVDQFTAIINPPEAAILAVSTAKELPVVIDGQIKVGNIMKMTLSADHRVTDGAEAAEFMRKLSVFIEQPWLTW